MGILEEIKTIVNINIVPLSVYCGEIGSGDREKPAIYINYKLATDKNHTLKKIYKRYILDLGVNKLSILFLSSWSSSRLNSPLMHIPIIHTSNCNLIK